MARRYNLTEGSIHHRFLQSTSIIQVFGGGFGNGKTSAAVIKGLSIGLAYPGANILIARETRPKLNDTIRTEFEKWCPPKYIESFPKSENSSNTCTLKNGTKFNFRYIRQEGKNAEASTSNLLSATYDLIIIDQVEDPGITYKDFLDLLGRRRGTAPFAGGYEWADYKDMPQTGPRWVILTMNPTRNWCYKKLVKPLHTFNRTGIVTEDLMHEVRDGKVIPLIELFEGPTSINKDNLPEDFIRVMETSYTGQMRKRFLEGEWGAYEGLVYPQFDSQIHVIKHQEMTDYLREICDYGVRPTILEAYDHGLQAPSCYGFAFVDFFGNVSLLDGFYEREFSIENAIKAIKGIRSIYLPNKTDDSYQPILADPDIFRRKSGNKKTVGISTAEIFADSGKGVVMRRANNDVVNGIAKVSSYLNVDVYWKNPYTGRVGAPRFYVSDKLQWFLDEINEYSWKKDAQGEGTDKPVDKNDHSMDMTKYLLTDRPATSTMTGEHELLVKPYMLWQTKEEPSGRRFAHRYGRKSF